MEKILPMNIEAECGVLGSALIDPEALASVMGFLRADDFYRDAHRTIYETMLMLHGKGMAADFITLCDALEERGKLAQVGDASYLTSLINRVPTSGNIGYYARIVERTSIQRRLIAAAGEIAQLGYDEPDVAHALEQAERTLFAVSQRYLFGQSSDSSMQELMNAYMETIEARYHNRGRIVGIPTGFVDLDRLLAGLQRSDLYVLAARPSVGKSAVAINIAYNAAMTFKRKVGIFSLEMSGEQIAQRFLSLASGVEQHRLRSGWLEDDDWPKAFEALLRLGTLGIRIDTTVGISLVQLASRARRWVAEYGIELLIVDYLQLIESSDEKKRDIREQEVARISRGLKNLARTLEVPVLALAQLSRAVESRQSKVPQLSDLRESGSIENDADVVMLIYRDDVYDQESERPNQTDIIVAKHRNGPVGTITLLFDQAHSRFATLSMDGFQEADDIVYAAEDDVLDDVLGEAEPIFPRGEEDEKVFPSDEDL